MWLGLRVSLWFPLILGQRWISNYQVTLNGSKGEAKLTDYENKDHTLKLLKKESVKYGSALSLLSISPIPLPSGVPQELSEFAHLFVPP